jgi:hypothetical protein
MNVRPGATIARPRRLRARTLLAHFSASVHRDTLAMEPTAKVKARFKNACTAALLTKTFLACNVINSAHCWCWFRRSLTWK